MSEPVAAQKPPSPAGDVIFRLICQACGMFILLVAAALLGILVWQSWDVLSRIGEYKMFTSTDWNPDQRPRVFGSWVFIYGTLATSLIAMLVAVPLGVGSAAFLSEIAPPWIRKTCSFLIELLAAIPSVVYGFWGLFFLTPGLQKLFLLLGGPPNTSGQGILAAGLILAIMIVPYVTAISFDVCRAVPSSQRQGSLALGATRWQMIWTVVLPYARPGIIAACFLALGRALGETMAVTMLIGNVRYIDFSLFASGDSIASVIANQLNEAGSRDHRSALVALGLVLFLITAMTNLAARFLIRQGAKPRVRVNRGPQSLTGPANAPAEFGPLVVSESQWKRTARENRVMTWVLGFCQLATVVPLFLILGYIGVRGASSLDWNFFTELPKPPGQLGGGMIHAIVGSGIIVLLASVCAVPIGVLTAVYLHEYNTHPLTKPVRFVTELLGGVPSIVIGIFAYALLVKPPAFIASLIASVPILSYLMPSGFTAWAGVFALGIMMLPVVVRTAEESMKLVPASLRQASYALGATQRQTVMRVILPASLPAITTGVLLAMGRIAGETAPLILTTAGSNFWPRSLYDRTPFLPGYIYEYSKSADADQQRQAWAAALVLLSAILLLNILIRVAAGRRVVAASRAD
ncbi:phosphate ABC transporter permease subunit PstC [Zavarzinella formosa]|uniref:phosphate ABC transporter permease subunit PstC n=1 Tax=Zavarzinella formosa TaxID=360055 RepID=UPI0002FB18B4|nr:phosphate ABC transporter permease subunit PstC [Zavarzinella formosa]